MIDETHPPRQRLAELLELAQSYRGWNRKQLGRALGRDPSKLVPSSGIPKLDVVVGLARVLEWPVEQVVRVLAGGRPEAEDPSGDDEEDDEDGAASGDSFEALDHAARHAHETGAYRRMIRLARLAGVHAANDEERVQALNREAGGWDALGRYAQAMAVIRQGLWAGDAALATTLLLQANLATTHYSLGQIVEGRGVASDVIDCLRPRTSTRITPSGPVPSTADVALATAHYARGNCYRRLLTEERHTASAVGAAARAQSDLLDAERLFLGLAEEHGYYYEDMAAVCRGGRLEAEVDLGLVDVEETLGHFQTALEPLVDPSSWAVGMTLERHGWWCLFACNIALRHVADVDRRDSLLALFTNKADEIAERLGHWALRERVLSLEFGQHLAASATPPPVLTLDGDDVRRITGVMGRFPAFASIGWRMLRLARETTIGR